MADPWLMGYHSLLLWWFRERRDDDEQPSLPGQLWLPRWQISIISIILHTSDYCFLAGRAWWVINSRVQSIQDPHPGILNHLFIRFWPICNCSRGNWALQLSVSGMPPCVDQGGVLTPDNLWRRAEGGVMWTGSMPTKIVTITIGVTLSHQRLSVRSAGTSNADIYQGRLRIWRYIFRRVE